MRLFVLAFLMFAAECLSACAAPFEDQFRARIVVTDAETGMPIKECSVVPAPWRKGPTTWQGQYRRQLISTDVFSMRRGWDPTALRIESAGYMPQIAGPLPRQTDHVLKIQLRKDPGIRGKVVSPDGKPVAGASVALCTWTREVRVNNSQIRYAREDRFKLLTTKADGQFQLPAEIDPWVLVIAHKSGYAERTREQLERDKPVRLEKWGRIEGQVQIGGKPLPNATVDLNAGRGDVDVVLHYSAAAKCDRSGRFSVDQLPPVKMYVKPIFQIGERRLSPLWFSGLAKIQAGETTKLSIPRPGQAIRGRIGLSPDSKLQRTDLKFDVTCYLRPPSVSGRTGSRNEAFTDYHAFTSSEWGRHFRRDQIKVAADGTFEITGLPETSYVLQVRARLKTDDDKSRPRSFLARRIQLKAKTADTPVLDLGTLQLRDQ